MKETKYVVRGTPIVPSVCGIIMAVLWYLYFSFADGAWDAGMNTLSFDDLTPFQTYQVIMRLALPVLFFIGVLFLAELNVRWMLLPLLGSVVFQVSVFVCYLLEDLPEYLFENPLTFFAPFLALILFALTVEKTLPNKWIFVGFCGAVTLLAVVLTVCGTGEFVYETSKYAADYTVVSVKQYLWSDLLSFVLYYIGLGALALQMRPPREGDFVTMKDLKQAYREKLEAQNSEEEPQAAEPSFSEQTEPISEESEI